MKNQNVVKGNKSKSQNQSSESAFTETRSCVSHGSSGWTVDLLFVQILARGNSGAGGTSALYARLRHEGFVCLCACMCAQARSECEECVFVIKMPLL